jgi:ribosomal-protein-alanine N-acetyltransferase
MKDFNSYFESIPELETERLRLTAFTREDMDAYFDILRDPKVQEYLGGGVPVFDKEPYISNWLRNINDRLLKRKIVFTWCIRDKESNRVVGRIDLGGFVKKTAAEISYHLSSDFWGREIATEAVDRVTRFGLDELGLARIQGLVRIENQASIRVLEKNGYLREGLLHH